LTATADLDSPFAWFDFAAPVQDNIAVVGANVGTVFDVAHGALDPSNPLGPPRFTPAPGGILQAHGDAPPVRVQRDIMQIGRPQAGPFDIGPYVVAGGKP
jgi:hypothetical protein